MTTEHCRDEAGHGHGVHGMVRSQSAASGTEAGPGVTARAAVRRAIHARAAQARAAHTRAPACSSTADCHRSHDLLLLWRRCEVASASGSVSEAPPPRVSHLEDISKNKGGAE